VGRLIVSESETSEKLTVKAKSAADKTKYGISEVAVGPGVATVDSVTVSPVVSPGGTHIFSAAVTGMNAPDPRVTWSILESADNPEWNAGTTITAEDVCTDRLTVAVDETLKSLTVRATALADTSAFTDIAITIVDAATVDSVTVTPASATMAPGGTWQFSAAVEGTGQVPQTVVWSVLETGRNAGTDITPEGKLIVSRCETLTALTVKAASKLNPYKTGTAVVMISDGGSMPREHKIPQPGTAVVAQGGTLNVPEGGALKVDGTLTVNGKLTGSVTSTVPDNAGSGYGRITYSAMGIDLSLGNADKFTFSEDSVTFEVVNANSHMDVGKGKTPTVPAGVTWTLAGGYLLQAAPGGVLAVEGTLIGTVQGVENTETDGTKDGRIVYAAVGLNNSVDDFDKLEFDGANKKVTFKYIEQSGNKYAHMAIISEKTLPAGTTWVIEAGYKVEILENEANNYHGVLNVQGTLTASAPTAVTFGADGVLTVGKFSDIEYGTNEITVTYSKEESKNYETYSGLSLRNRTGFTAKFENEGWGDGEPPSADTVNWAYFVYNRAANQDGQFSIKNACGTCDNGITDKAE